MNAKPISKQTCPECGAEIGQDAPLGLCLKCLARAGAAGESSATQAETPTVVTHSQPCAPTDPQLSTSVPHPATSRPLPSDARGAVGEGARSFGDYELFEEIARGGMGIVYRARQRSLHRIVAVKMILAGQFAGQQLIQRFRAEVTSAALLKHPNIVPIHEVGIHEGQHFFSMDYVEGQNLTQLVGHRPLPPKHAARYVKQIAEAIHYAHQQRILHRDLKPSNVLIDAASDQPRVTDFGLAKRLDGESSITVTGQVLGSPNFMPPEQASAQRGKVGRPSDVYGLGGILYYTLTARAPFQGATLETTIHEVLNTEPLSPRALNPSVARDLETICLKCLEKEPAKRYASAQELAAELDRFLRDEPIHARPVTRAERVWRWCRRKPALAASLALALLLLLTVAIGAPIAALRIRQRSEALRRHLYVSDMGAAYQAVKEGEVARAKQIIDRHRPKRGEEDLRGFEWRYLWALCWPNAQSIFPAENQLLNNTVFSPDGKMMAGWDSNVVVYDVASRALLHRFQWFDDKPEVSRRLIFSRDGGFLAAKGRAEIRVWRTADWSEVFHSSEAKLNPNSGNGLVISPDGTTVAAPTEGGVGFWNIQSGQKILAADGSWPTLPGDDFLGMRMAYSADGAFLAVSHYTTNQIRDARTLGIITNLVHPGRETTAFRTLSIAFSTNYMAAGYREGEFRLWETKSWHEVARINAHANFVTALDFSLDGRYLASGGQQEQVIYLWDVADLVGRQSDSATPKPLATLKGHTNSINSIHFSPDGQTLAATSRGGSTKFWSVPSKTETSVTLNHSLQVLWISSDGRRFISFNDDKQLYVWDTGDALRSRLLKLPTEIYLYGPRAVSPDGKTVAFGQADGTTEVWNLETSQRAQVVQPIRLHPSHENFDLQLGFSPDSRLLFCFQPSAGIVIKDLAGARKDIVLTNAASPFALSRDGRVLATARRTGDRIELWEMAENRSQGTFEVPTAADWAATSGALCFSPNGELLVVASVRTDSIQVWNVKTRRRERVLPMQKPFIESMVFSPDGGTLVVRSIENVVAFWNVATWEEMFREFHYCPGDGVVRFSADGSALTFPERLSLDGQRPYLLWRAPLMAEIETAERAKPDGASSTTNGSAK